MVNYSAFFKLLSLNSFSFLCSEVFFYSRLWNVIYVFKVLWKTFGRFSWRRLLWARARTKNQQFSHLVRTRITATNVLNSIDNIYYYVIRFMFVSSPLLLLFSYRRLVGKPVKISTYRSHVKYSWLMDKRRMRKEHC